MSKKIVKLILVCSSVILVAGCAQLNSSVSPTSIKPPDQKPPLVGGDRDEHGCIGSAGYSWCEVKQKCLRVWEESCDDTQTVVKYLISEEDPTKYCNGADMDSAGYRKTITKEVTTTTVAATSSVETAKQIAVLATDGMCQQVLKQLAFKVTGDTVSIPPIEGWAGVSITMCSCKPRVEVNLLRLPGISRVVWE